MAAGLGVGGLFEVYIVPYGHMCIEIFTQTLGLGFRIGCRVIGFRAYVLRVGEWMPVTNLT